MVVALVSGRDLIKINNHVILGSFQNLYYKRFANY